jgi:hypothetical protein
LDTTNIIIGVVGVGASLVTYFLTYRHRISARKERGVTAYREIISIMTRFLSQSKLNPTLDVIQGLTRSKAREHNVNMVSIPSLPAIFEDLITKFIENEFISPDTKNDIVSRIKLLQNELETEEARERMIIETPEVPKFYNILILAAAIIAPMFFALLIMLPTTEYYYYFTRDIYILMMALLFLAVAFSFYIKPRREKEEKEAESTAYISPIFENMIFSALKRHLPEGNIEKGVFLKKGGQVDLVLRINDEKIPMAVKFRDVKSGTVQQISDYKNQLGAKRAIVITNSSVAERIRKSADAKNIIIIDDVNSEEDMINRLKEINIIEG